jgi:hypothetical protein
MLPTSEPKYDRLDSSPDARSSEIDEGERTAFLDSLADERKKQQQKRSLSRRLSLVSVCNAIFFIISVVLYSTWYYQTHLLLNPELRRTSTFSPVHDRLDLGMQVKKVNGTLFASKDSPSLARHKPSPEFDEFWEEWELTRVYPVTAAEIRAMGKDVSTAVKLEDSIWGLGDDAYGAIFDVYHQLHCLNFLRKLIYPNYYNVSTWHNADIEGLFEVHMNHCVDIVMQAIQCSGNVNLITLHWVETQTYPFPDMSVNRQCVNFDGITQYRLENTIDMDKYVEVMGKPEGVKEAPAPSGYYDFFMGMDPHKAHEALHGGR